MDTILFSSGDPIADRRFSYAQMLADNGEFAAALDLVAQALELVPDFLPGLELVGRYAESAGQMPEAFDAWRRMLVLDPSDKFGAELKLAAHGALTRREVPAFAYVETLFDAYASDFDAALAQRLAYTVPQRIEAALAKFHGDVVDDKPGFARALDLGCGTGLMGERLRRHCSQLEGVDLSEAMVSQARRKRIYDKVEQGELLAWLGRPGPEADLITAADVFGYFGALDAVFAAIAEVLKPGGLFAFSVEAHDGPEPCVLRSTLRFAHSEAGLRDGLNAAGFTVLEIERTDIRMDRDAPIVGFIVTARRSGEGGLEDAGLGCDLPVREIPKPN